MADAINEAIRDALYARLGSLVLSPVHPIAWRNVNFTKPASNRYLEARFVPNDNSRFGVDGGPHDRFGFLQVNVRDALNTGSRVEGIAGAVAAHFPADLPLYGDLGVKVRITKDTDPGEMIVETTPPGVMVPVLIPYECLI
jgi:hypothetical protein